MGDADPGGYRFPAGFLWGAATSSHQVEGNNRFSDWWAYEQEGLLPYSSGDACQQYERYEADFELAREGGHTAHRLSIEWSRVEPREGRWDEDALQHYHDVMLALHDRGLEPIVTLHHFTNPRWFADRGGWSRNDSPRLFARYVDRVAARLASQVRIWVTVNEPTVYVKRGFVTGEWPPARRRAWIAGARALRHMCGAHVAAYRVLHRHRSDALVGLAHNAPLIQACRPERAADRWVARMRDLVLNGLVFRLIGARRPRNRPGGVPLDFVGLNYYTRSVVHWGGWGAGALVGRECSEHVERGPFTAMDWEIYPDGLFAMLDRFSWMGLPILVTENGIATEDESVRSAYLVQHLEALGRAVDRGLNVIGYLYWSLIDNFEWSNGTIPRFGLVAVDYETQARTSRPAFELYERVCRSNRLPSGLLLERPPRA